MDVWYGLMRDGSPVAIRHAALMDWARRHDKEFQVGWGDRLIMNDGTRLVRASGCKTPADVAEAAGWTDLAERLRAERPWEASDHA